MTSLAPNPQCARTWATFRLIGDALQPDEVSAAVGLTPTLALATGEAIPAGELGKERRQRVGIWLLASEHRVASTNLERHLIYLLDVIEPAATTIKAVRARQHLRADFCCYWASADGDGGPQLSAATLARIAALDASLGIDFFDDSD